VPALREKGKLVMTDREKIVTALEHCRQYGALCGKDCSGIFTYMDNGKNIVKANEYRYDCPYGKCKTGCVVTLIDDTIALLKEQQSLIDEITQMKMNNGAFD
jgi:hypothetical protein